jgi:hypothetical protein
MAVTNPVVSKGNQMEVKIIDVNNHKIAEILADGVTVNNIRDALDVIANADYQGASRVMLHQTHLHPDFFDLRTGLAGEILQKYANYQIKLAVVGEFDNFNSKSLDAFILECNRGSSVFFVPDRDAAIARLLK